MYTDGVGFKGCDENKDPSDERLKVLIQINKNLEGMKNSLESIDERIKDVQSRKKFY